MRTTAAVRKLAGSEAVEFDPDALRAFLGYILDPSLGCAEVRIFEADINPKNRWIVPAQVYKKTVVTYGDDIEDLVAEVGRVHGTSVYVTLNPLDPALKCRANKLVASKVAAKDEDVTRIRFLYLDADPNRPDGISSTEEQRIAAARLIERIRTDHPELVPSSLYGCSGNGYWQLVRLPDYPNDEEHRELISRVTDWFAAKYSDAVVKIDVKTKNPARVMPAVGTRKCKGISTPERPHRLATLESPRHFRPEPFDLKAWAALRIPATGATSEPGDGHPTAGDGFPQMTVASGGWSAADRARAYVLSPRFPDSIAGEDGHGVLYHVACVLVDGFGLSKQQALPIYEEFNRLKAKPPESLKQVHHKLDDAIKNHPAPSLEILNRNRDGLEPRRSAPGVASDVPVDEPGGTAPSPDRHAPAEWPATPAGTKVLCTDRNPPNFGEVVEDLGGSARVHFISPSGHEATVVLLKSCLAEIDGSPLGKVESPKQHEEELESAEILDRWPKIDEQAFHGLAGEIVRLADPHTEADRVATLIQFLVAFGNLIDRTNYFAVGATRHHLNLYVAIVGATAAGRKGTSWDVVCWLLGAIDPDWLKSCIKAGLVSGEGLIYHVRDPVWEERESKGKAPKTREVVCVDEGVADKRLLVVETEMSRVLKAINRDSNTLSDVLRLGWDTGQLRTLAKHSKDKATNAHISVIAHVTQADIKTHLTETDSANGFANRFIWALSRRSKYLPDGGDLDSENWEPIRNRLRSVIAFARQQPEDPGDHWETRVGNPVSFEPRKMLRDPVARRAWHAVYPNLSAGRPGLVGKILSRAEPQVSRIACLYALLDQSASVRIEHLKAALAVWEYCEASAREIFGASLGNPDAEKILKALREKPNGMTRTEISVEVFGRHKKADELAALLEDLLTQGIIHRTTDDSGRGRRAERWFAVKPTEAKPA